MTPTFSVVIPVYNRAQILKRALVSVLAQSDGDFEIVVVDDGSRDDPRAVVDALGDARISLIRQENGGGGAARNTGIRAAKGRYVAFLDSDDRFLPHHLAAMRALLAERDDVAGYAQVIVDRGHGRTLVKPPRALGEAEDMAEYLLCDRGFTPTSTLVVPRALAGAVLFPQDLREAEDTDFAIRLALAGCSFRMARTPGAVWTDHFDPDRLSAGRSTARLANWLDAMKPRLTAKAYRGGRGWAVAKGVAMSHPLRALGYFVSAMLHGCYRPRLAAIVFLQIFLPDAAYRAVADRAIGWLRLTPRDGTVPLGREHPC